MKRVILTPELLLSGLKDASSVHVLNAWRDGLLKPVLNRELMVCYTQGLRAAGLKSEYLRPWIWWLSDPEKSDFLSQLKTECSNATSLCEHLFGSSGADAILHSDSFQPSPNHEKVKWMSASIYLQTYLTHVTP